MKKASTVKTSDELRREYDLTKLKGGVRGKYDEAATAGTNLVLIDPDLATVFPDSAAVNRALRLLADTAQSSVRPRSAPDRAQSAVPKTKPRRAARPTSA
jgi:hypothetical protein